MTPGLAAGAALRDDALAGLARRRAGLIEAARRALIVTLLECDSATVDCVRAAVPLPADVGPKLFGCVPGELVRLGLIEPAGFTPSARREAHARPLQRWRLRDRDAALSWLRSHAPPDDKAAAAGRDGLDAAGANEHDARQHTAPPSAPAELLFSLGGGGRGHRIR